MYCTIPYSLRMSINDTSHMYVYNHHIKNSKMGMVCKFIYHHVWVIWKWFVKFWVAFWVLISLHLLSFFISNNVIYYSCFHCFS